MIPEFPKFKRLEITDRADVEKITSRFPPYSDFNFTSMWCWDTEGQARLSILNDNLVVRFTDYITGEPFYSFLGNKLLNETAEQLMSLLVGKRIERKLKLIPEVVANGITSPDYLIEEDRDNYDYIYDADKLKVYKGKAYEQLRNMKNRFNRKYENIKVVSLDLIKPNNREIIQNLNQQWEINKGYRLDNEEDAMTRLLFPVNNFQLISIAVFVNGNPVAFSINEFLNNGHAISHFVKADTRYSGVYSYLMYATADALTSRGCGLLNYEQDLGIPGLRQAKTAFRPAYFLKKYIIQD